jgi:hypothetical protein
MEMDKEFAKKELEKQMRKAEAKQAMRIANEREMNLLEPGEDPGEGYKGSPDMYPDYEEDKKLSPTEKTLKESYRRIKEAEKKSKGGSILVKTKLGRTKPTKIY